MKVMLWRSSVSAILIIMVSACHPKNELNVRRAVIARVGKPDIQIRSMREVPGRTISLSAGRVAHLGAGVCGELSGDLHRERYFIWERASGKIYLADESGIVSGGVTPFFWRSYCRE